MQASLLQKRRDDICCLYVAKVYQLLAHGRWFSPGTPASSTTKSGRHDIAEILLKVALKHQIKKNNQNKLLFINRPLFLSNPHTTVKTSDNDTFFSEHM
jgi:hypothetical protein